MNLFSSSYRVSHTSGLNTRKSTLQVSRFSTSFNFKKMSLRTTTQSRQSWKTFLIVRDYFSATLSISWMRLRIRTEITDLTGSIKKKWRRLWHLKRRTWIFWIISLWKRDSNTTSSDCTNASNISSSRRIWNLNRWNRDAFQRWSRERIARTIELIDDE